MHADPRLAFQHGPLLLSVGQNRLQGWGRGVLVGWLMKKVHKLTALVFVVLWVPITSHCQLEKVPGLEFLHCASDTPGNSDCQGDGCQVIESGFYKISDNSAVV